MKKTLLATLFIAGSAALFAQDSTTNNTGTNTNTTTNTTTTTDDNTNTSTNTSTDVNTTNQGTNTNNQGMNNTNQMNGNNQMNTTNQQQTTTTGNYSAYSTVNVPSSVQYSFTRQNPTATNPQWEQRGEWYRVTYRNNNQDMLMYYNGRGDGYAVAIPVLHTYVPTEVVQMARNKYGWDVYDIKMIKGAKGQNLYQVRIIQNGGEVRTETWDETGTSVAEIDLYRSDSTVTDVINTPDQNMNNNQMNNNNNNTNNLNNNSSGSGTDMNMQNNTNTPTNTDAGTTTDDQSQNNTNNNNGTNEVKIKSEATNGQETKIKAKKGEVKVKTDD